MIFSKNLGEGLFTVGEHKVFVLLIFFLCCLQIFEFVFFRFLKRSCGDVKLKRQISVWLKLN